MKCFAKVTPVPVTADQGSRHADEVIRGERFEFGVNWRHFLDVLDDERIEEAQASLREMLGVETLEGRRFLDAGSGSGLFSLAARRLGAERVHSFDFDPQSVACTRELRRRYFDGDSRWEVEEGSVLDERFVAGLGSWDVVYSWGVLHHTGDMWRGLDLARSAVEEGGALFVAIYNDQGVRSTLWKGVKRLYNALPRSARLLLTWLVMWPQIVLGFARAATRERSLGWGLQWDDYKRKRGMSRWHDIVDWMGGYPFEVAKPEEVFAFLRERGFELERLVTCGGKSGCNQFVFRRAGKQQ